MNLGLTVADWIAIATIALPLIAKAFSDWSANAAAKHNLALARITDMAGRQAATIARSLASLPAGTNATEAERVLISDASRAMLGEMEDSAGITGANATKLGDILQGELNKLLVQAPAAPAKPATSTP